MSKQQTYPFWLVPSSQCVGASMAACCTHPLDLAKVRMQTMASQAGKRPSTYSVLRMSVSQSGVKSLYTGLSASLLRQMSYSLVRLGSYENLKARLRKKGTASTGQLLLAAMLAGGMGGVAGNPADILLVRMTSDVTRPPEQRYNYSNALSGLVELIRQEGVRGLFRGLGTNTGSQVGSYDFFKSKLLHNPVPIIDYQLRDNLLLHTVSSLLAGTVATTVCAPADVMRSRLMSATGKTSPIKMLQTALREEGPRFLFKGWTPAFIRLGPNTVFMFVFFEQLKKGWRTMFPTV
ncbi:dicarboxylic acid transporter [Amylocystis lapponica]|nr:dicarboxylic acid transporter [Amylocystis lapponica]